MDRFDRIYALHKELVGTRRPISSRVLQERLECARAPSTASSMLTPYEKLKSLPETQQHLKSGTTFAQLDAIASRHLNEARAELFRSINKAQVPAV